MSLVCSKKVCSASISAVFATDQIKTKKVGNVFRFADETSSSQIECVTNFRYDSMKNCNLSFKTSSYILGYFYLTIICSESPLNSSMILSLYHQHSDQRCEPAQFNPNGMAVLNICKSLQHQCEGSSKDDIIKRKCRETRLKIASNQNLNSRKIKELALDKDRSFILDTMNSDLGPNDTRADDIPVDVETLFDQTQRQMNRALNHMK